MNAGVCSFSRSATLRDGGSIRIRAIRPDDRERLRAHFERLSERSRYFRFHNAKTRLSDSELALFVTPDFVAHVGLVATIGEPEEIVGVARYFRGTPPDVWSRAEVACAVVDEHQGRGIATLLLEALVSIAAEAGVRELWGSVLPENWAMLDVFRAFGFAEARADGDVRVSLVLEKP
jgi:RimJ/RimL family protein N-acetyltransferase